jgi:hypothetical protein
VEYEYKTVGYVRTPSTDSGIPETEYFLDGVVKESPVRV